ncbi:hypothetical protein LDENG_00293030 [Lucifuga dentata]|nr:hypothetical protein LDENG_00293030 [Lucifuga dentata]
MDEQEVTMDFKALRAKFQDEELLLKQPRMKPALPEKPKVLPPPASPIHHLPPGARSSLLTSINQSLENKTLIAPRVAFKDEKKDSKKPLVQSNMKGKEKNDGKVKGGKDKATKGSKEKLVEDLSDQKPKKDSIKKLQLVLPVAPKDSTAELVPAAAPPKVTALKKKGILGFRKSVKKEAVDVPADPILDTLSSDVAGVAPLIPVPVLFGGTAPEPEISPLKAVMPPTLLITSPAIETHPPSTPSTLSSVTPPPVPTSSDITPPPAFIPDIPAPTIPTSESESPLELKTPVLPVSLPPRPASPHEIIPTPPSSIPTPPPTHSNQAIPSPTPAVCIPSPTPEQEITEEEAVGVAEVVEPPAPVIDPPSIPSSPKLERPISALSALERAEEMNPGKRASPADQRILSALEKARRKAASSSLTNPSTLSSVTPPPEEHPPPSPTQSFPDLPPIDYEDRAGKSLKPKPGQVNGFDHRQASPVLEDIAEEGSDAIPELLVLPPLLPRKSLPQPECLDLAPEKPPRPPSAHLSTFFPPSVEENAAEMPVPPGFSDADTIEVPEFEDVASETHSTTEWGNGEHAGLDSPDGQYYRNELPLPVAELHRVSVFGGEHQDNTKIQDYKPVAGSQAKDNGAYDNPDNVYEDVTSATKKKGKIDGGKKRKGPPKNPYAETAHEATNEEKVKTSRFGKNDKKTTPEGPDEKELKKKEKQRLEKEKKELKEQKEREKKEQKEREKRESEREKKENEMKKKFNITGQEDAMYQAKVTVTTKGRKNDLPVNSGDIVSIIRTTNCPIGKWLARDSSNTYGYIAVDHVELDIKEMLELGKKAAITHKSNSNLIEVETTSTGSRTSNQYPQSTGSFSDDSEEWTGDDDDVVPLPSEITDPLSPPGHTRTHSMPDMSNKELSINHQHSHSDLCAEGPHAQAKHEALQKLTTFFYLPNPAVESSARPEPSSMQEVDFEVPDTLILPPPDLYADSMWN